MDWLPARRNSLDTLTIAPPRSGVSDFTRTFRPVSKLRSAGNQSTPVDYLMRKSGASWKVFDVMVEGVSFVQTFRSQFDAPLSNKSIKQVAADLRAGRVQADAKQ